MFLNFVNEEIKFPKSFRKTIPRNELKKVTSILLFFILSCTEKTDPEGVGVDENIVGEPILETAQQVFVEENQTEDNNSIVVFIQTS